MSTDNIKKAIQILATCLYSSNHLEGTELNEINTLLNDTPEPKFTYLYKHSDGFKEGPAPEGYDDGAGLLAKVDGWATLNDDGTPHIQAGTVNLKEAEDVPEIPEGYEIVKHDR